MRVKGQKGHNDETSILFISALHRRIDFDRYLDQGIVIKLFRGESLEAVCNKKNDIYLFYVTSGATEVGVARNDERLTVLYVRGENDVIISDYQGLVSFGDSRFVVKAVRNTVLVGFTYEQVKKFVFSDDIFFDDIMYTTHMTLAQMEHRIDNTAWQSSSKRILLWLEKLCEANRPDIDGVFRIPCNLTIDECAGLLEIHYATCSKLCRALKERGILDKTRKYLEIRDRAQLQHLLQEENPILY